MEYFFFNAAILRMVKFQLELSSTEKHTRITKDYELDFYLSGNRSMLINGKQYAIDCNSVVFRRPGDHTVSKGNYNCYCLTLDFSQKKETNAKYDQDPRKDHTSPIQDISTNPLLEIIPNHFVAPNPNEYIKIFDKLCYTYRSNTMKQNQIILNQLFFKILSDIYSLKSKDSVVNQDNLILSKTCHYIQENFGEPITIQDLAKNVALSESYFIKTFKKIAHITPIDYLISIRLSNAKRYLAESTLSIVEISNICGFNNASYFSYYFKKKVGMTPNQYRAKKILKNTVDIPSIT